MNRTFKVIFNQVLGRHVVVSEIAGSIQRGARKAITVAAAVGALAMAASLPMGDAWAFKISDHNSWDYGSDVTSDNSQWNNTAVGNNAVIGGQVSTAVGQWVTTGPGSNNTAIGQNTRIEGGNGQTASQAASNAIAIGAGARIVDWSIYDTYSGWGAPPTYSNYNSENRLSPSGSIVIGGSARAEAMDTTTVGRASRALMRNATAYGNNAHANSVNSIAIGNKAIAGLQSHVFNSDGTLVQVDPESSADPGASENERVGIADDSAVAVGNRATAINRYTTAVGVSSYADGRHSVAVGDSNRATGAYSTAIGAGYSIYDIDETDAENSEKVRTYTRIGANQAAGDYSTAAGYDNKTVGRQSSGFGVSNAVSGTDSLAAGSHNTVGVVAVGEDGIVSKNQENIVTGYAVGSENEIKSFKNAEAGDGTNEGSSDGTGDGQTGEQTGGETGSGTDGGNGDPTSGGTAGEAGGEAGEGGNGDAGEAAAQSRSYAGAYGHKNTVHGDNGYAMGNENKIHQGADNALAIGIGNVLGVEAAADAEDSGNGEGGEAADESSGTSSTSAGKDSIAMGNGNTVTGEQSIAVGNGHQVFGDNAGAFGDPDNIYANASYSVGNNNTIGNEADKTAGINTFVVGSNVTTTEAGTVVVGHHAEGNEHTFGENSVSLGTDAQAQEENYVALGSYALADEKGGYEKPDENDVEVGNLTYSSSSFAGTGEKVIGTVSVGDDSKVRTITNVAAGRIAKDSTDAINGSQLYAASDQLQWKVGIDKDGGTNNDGALEQSIVGKPDAKTDKSNVQFIAGKGIDISQAEIIPPKDSQETIGGYGIKVSSKFEEAGTENGKITSITYEGETYELGGDKIATDNRVVGLKENQDGEQEIISPFIHIDGVKDATAEGHESGHYAYAEGENGIAIGSEARARSKDAIALGVQTNAYGEQSIAIGEGATAGDKTDKTKGKGAVAIGGKSASTGEFSVAMQGGKATGDYAMAFGENTTASGSHATAFGKDAVASGEHAVAYGNNSHAAGKNSLAAMGGTTTETASNATAIGEGATASGVNAIALGSQSTASGENTLAAIGGNVAEGADNSAAIGKGASATVSDAVALGSRSVAGQLSGKETGQSGYDILVNGNSAKTDHVWRSTENAIAVGDAGNKVTRKIIGVAAGHDDTDAVNVAQLKRVSEAIGTEAAKHTQVTVEGGNAPEYNADKSQLGDYVGGNLQIAKKQADGKDVFDLKLNEDIDLGKDGSVTIGDTNITGDTVTTNTVKTDNIQLGGDEGTNITYNKKGDRITYGDKEVATTDDGMKYKGDFGDEAETKLNRTVKVVGEAKSEKDLTTGNIGVIATQDGDDAKLTVKLNKDVDLGEEGSVKTGDTTINNDGMTINGGPTINKDKIDVAGNKITNVKAGEDDGDAVNVSQLNEVKQMAGAHTTVTVDGKQADVTEGNLLLTKSTNENGGENYDLKLNNKLDLGDEGSVTAGDTKVENNSITVGKAGDRTTINGGTVTTNTVKAGDTTIHNDGVTIAKGGKTVNITNDNGNVSVGGARITNVARGEADTDAVNVSQLKQSEANFNQSIHHLNSRIGEVAQDANAGIAMALAAASLPQVYLPGKSMMAVAGGTYRGESGYAIGFSTISDDGKWIIKANASGNSQGHYGAAIGAGYMW